MPSVLATAYGPPWDAMQGSGVTSTGVNLQGGKQLPIIAVDPSLIPYGSIVRVSNSPFGANKLFVAGDTGGAIKGNHIDFFVASGRQAQMGWGARNVNLQVVARGSGPGSVQSALQRVSSQGLPQMASSGSRSGASSPQSFQIPGGTVQWQGTGFNQQAFQQAQRASLLGNYIRQTARNNPYGSLGAPSSGLSALFAAGKATTGTPDPTQFFEPKTYTYKLAQTALQGVAGSTVLAAHPQVQTGGKLVAGGFLPQGAKYTAERKDQGRDGVTNPGGPIVANGNGYVVRIGVDPGGFGPRYPIVHFTSGPYAGRTIYFGHTLATVGQGQHVRAGQVISHTGTSGVGNATVPGWFEIGFADSGTPGPFGQPTPF